MHHLTMVSSNKKVGPIPVSTHTMNSCPDACPLKGNGCYADYGPLKLHWKKVTSGQRGGSWDDFIRMIKKLPKGQLWRYAQAGDLPGDGNDIDRQKLDQLVKANKFRFGWAYTHKPLTDDNNLQAIKSANANGFTVNISANNQNEAVELFKKHQLPTVTVLPLDAKNLTIVNGVKVVACPAETKNISCARCGLCQVRDRSYIIGFRAHGTGKKKANQIAVANI